MDNYRVKFNHWKMVNKAAVDWHSGFDAFSRRCSSICKVRTPETLVVMGFGKTKNEAKENACKALINRQDGEDSFFSVQLFPDQKDSTDPKPVNGANFRMSLNHWKQTASSEPEISWTEEYLQEKKIHVSSCIVRQAGFPLLVGMGMGVTKTSAKENSAKAIVVRGSNPPDSFFLSCHKV